MVHRVFRLSISPDRAPEVRRVVDFDGRATLHDVHDTIQRVLDLDDDHLYAFYLSGKYFDRSSEHSPDGARGRDSRRSVLFRLGLNVGQKLAYVFDFGDELRHTVAVVSITEGEVPLGEPVLVESVGDAPPQYDTDEDDEEPYELPEYLTEVVPLAEAVLALSERLDELYEDDDEHEEARGAGEPAGPPEAIVQLLRELSKAALELAGALDGDEEALQALDEWSQDRELIPRLLELPLGLVNVGELDSALAVARAFTFVAAEALDGDIAIIFAEAGKRDEAIARLESNLKKFPESWLTAIKAGGAYEALGDAAAAEASYRRALVLAEDESQEDEAVTLLAGLLEDLGRIEEVDAILSLQSDDAQHPDEPRSAETPLSAVGRNDPCPCGSGKKYKKCHGAPHQPPSAELGPRKIDLTPVGYVRSRLMSVDAAPRQGDEGAPRAVLEFEGAVVDALDGIAVNDELIVLTWLHEAHRDVLKVHPRGDATRPLTGVFATRSQHRPNPIGIHTVCVTAILARGTIEVDALEAIDGTPILDVKPVLSASAQR